MLFSIQKELFDRFPDLTIGAVVATGMNNSLPSPEIEQLLLQTVEALRGSFGSDKVQEHPRIKPWRTAFSKLGISGSKFPSSIESMTRRILRGDPFPMINPLVNLYNSVSLKHLVPMGGHDLDPLTGNLFLGFADGGEPFTAMGGEDRVTVPKGELVYRDGEEVLTRNWVWRQCDKDKTTERTKNIFIPIDVLGEVGREIAEKIIQELIDLIPRHFGGKVFSMILDKDQLSTELPLPEKQTS